MLEVLELLVITLLACTIIPVEPDPVVWVLEPDPPPEIVEYDTFIVMDYHTDGVFDYEIMFDNEEQAKDFGVQEYNGYTVGAMTSDQHDYQEHSCKELTTSYLGECINIAYRDGLAYYGDDIIIFSNKAVTGARTGDIYSIERGWYNG